MSANDDCGIDFRESTVLVPVYQAGQHVDNAIIDAEDADRVLKFRWRFDRHGYARTDVQQDGERSNVSMHRLVLDLPSKEGVVDHIDRDRLNNCKSNLRVVDHVANHQNRPSKRPGYTSEHRNVSWDSRSGKWHVQLVVDGQIVRLGRFEDEDHAAEIAAIGRAILMPYSEDAAMPRGRVWRAAQAKIPTEREIADWPVEGDEAARAIRLSELCGDVMAAVGRGHTDVFDELSKVIACCTAWAEELAQR
jgi:hypothetical protein